MAENIRNAMQFRYRLVKYAALNHDEVIINDSKTESATH
jgi:hypothetical protein